MEALALVTPRVARPVLLNVGPRVREEDFAGLADVGKGVQDVGEVGGGDILGGVVARVDGPARVSVA